MGGKRRRRKGKQRNANVLEVTCGVSEKQHEWTIANPGNEAAGGEEGERRGEEGKRGESREDWAHFFFLFHPIPNPERKEGIFGFFVDLVSKIGN